MASLGEAFVIQETGLSRVRAAAVRKERRFRSSVDEFWDVVGRETVEHLSYPWPGYILATLLSYLDERGIDLLHSEHDEDGEYISGARNGSIFVLTPSQRDLYVERLNPEEFDGEELRRYYEEFTETEAEGVEEPMVAGVLFLRDMLAVLRDGTVALLVMA
jgi:hypothetical protein